ncbi:MAG: ABC-2 family transporter protein [Planctomycetes bacterium]|nr:ABC-2 family transporter protein [Planctomycetota bacterium]
MNTLSRHLLVGWLYVVQAMKMRLEYRADFAVECLAALLQQATQLLVLEVLFDNVPLLQNWKREEVFFIYGFMLLPRALFDATAMSFYMFSDKYLVQGEMDRLLLRPLSTLFQMMMEGISFDFLADLALGITVLSYASSKLGLEWTYSTGLLLVVMMLGAYGVLTGVFLTMTGLSFWSQDRVGLIPPVYNLLNFAQYPLNIFHKVVVFILTFMIPFGFVAYYPSTLFLRESAQIPGLAWFTPLAGLICLAVAGFTWRAGLRQYAGAGS